MLFSSPFSSMWAPSSDPLVRSPRTQTSPLTIRPGRSTSFRIDRAMTLLPHPDSPTTATVCPRWISKSTPSTAFTTPSSRWKCVRSPRTRTTTESSAMASYPSLAVPSLVRIRRVSEAVTDQVHRQDGHEDGSARRQQPRRGLERSDVLCVLQQDPPAHGGRLQAQAPEAQRRLPENH